MSSPRTRTLAVCLLFSDAASFAQGMVSPADSAAIVALVEHLAATARYAWQVRDASLMVGDSTTGGAIQTPHRTVTVAELRADLQRRMNMTVRVDTLVEVLDSIRAFHRDSVVAYTTQRFVRVIRLPDGTERQRISTVIHQRELVHRAGEWQPSGPLREINPRAWWADEAARRR